MTLTYHICLQNILLNIKLLTWELTACRILTFWIEKTDQNTNKTTSKRLRKSIVEKDSLFLSILL